MVKLGLDFNLARGIRGVPNPIARTANELGQTCFCASDVALAADHFSRMYRSLQRRAQGQTFHLSRPIFVPGVRASAKLYHMGFRSTVSRNTLANANAARDWRIYADLVQYVWIAVSVYVLLAILRKRLNITASLYEMLQILSLTMFERMALNQLLARTPMGINSPAPTNQLFLFD